MKANNRIHTWLCAFALTAGLLPACQDDGDGMDRLPAGSVPLVLGDVSVAGVQKAHTRAAITENNAGYTGIRKSRLVENDALNLTLTYGGGEQKQVTATLDATGQWVITPSGTFLQPGTTITATHTATVQTTDIPADNLKAESVDCSVANDGKVTIAMKHAGAMIDITTGASANIITSVKVNGAPTETEEETDGNHYRTLVPAGMQVTSITAVISGTTYLATLVITLEANKRYPVALTFKNKTLTATVGAASLDWADGGEVPSTVPGYDRVISTPEDLAQFAKDVNDDAAGTGARKAVVLQTKDIDLSRLKPLADAQRDNPEKNYSYTATADN